MKKRIFSMFLAVAMIATMLVGCGAKEEAATTETATTEETTEEAAEYKVAMVINSSVSDGGWGSSCFSAMMDAAEARGWETAYTENVATADYVTAFSDYADLGYNLIFAPGGEYQDAVAEVAAEYPETYFCLLNGTLETDNVTSVLPDAAQIGYMAGALAGLMTETNYVGFIGAIELDTTVQKIACYEEAAKIVNPDCQVTSSYAGSFDDAAKGKEIASSMITTYDVDVMFGDASAVDTGAREAMAAGEGRFAIAQPGDFGSAEDEVIICSVVTDNSALVGECMDDLVAGTYGNKTIYGDLANGCLSVGTFSNVVPEEIQTQYLEYVEQIKAGTFVK